MQIPSRAHGLHFESRRSSKRYVNTYLNHDVCIHIDEEQFKSAWDTGDFSFVDSGGFSTPLKVTVTAIEINEEILLDQLGWQKSRMEQNPARSGGRPSPNHGEAIASLTLQLSALSTAELNGLTNQHVAADLLLTYKNQPRTPPSQDSLEKYAGGILRVLRAGRA